MLGFAARITNHFIFPRGSSSGFALPSRCFSHLPLRDAPWGAMKGMCRRYVRSMLEYSTDKELLSRIWPSCPLYAARLRQQRVRRKGVMTTVSPKEWRANARHHIRTILPCPQPRYTTLLCSSQECLTAIVTARSLMHASNGARLAQRSTRKRGSDRNFDFFL